MGDNDKTSPEAGQVRQGSQSSSVLAIFFFSCQSDTTRDTWEDGTLIKELLLANWPVAMSSRT